MAGAIAKLHPYKMKSVADLRPFDRNARTHSPAQVKQIAAAITEWGWTNPVLIDPDGGIIAGHGRVLAAQLLEMDKIPTITIAGLTDQQRRALVIADNKLAMNAGWDDAMLKVELLDLQADGFAIDLIGFGVDDLALLFDETGASEQSAGGHGSLAERFGVPPFSVLNAREGWWQDRKRAWLALGIQSELGRGAGNEAAPGGGGGDLGARWTERLL